MRENGRNALLLLLDTARGPAIAAVDGDFFKVGVLDSQYGCMLGEEDMGAYLGVDVLLCSVSEGALGDHLEKLCRHGGGCLSQTKVCRFESEEKKDRKERRSRALI